ncbi:MAG: prohibitin family protein, partial [Terracidiphilus sp.]
MLALKMLFAVAGALSWAVALAIPLYGLWLRLEAKLKKPAADGTMAETFVKTWTIPWQRSMALALAGCVPMLMAASIVVVPSGAGGVRISQVKGTLPGTLYPGMHFVTPLIDSVEIFDLRDHVFSTGSVEQGASKTPAAGDLTVQSLEGLNIGLGITVRYRLDPNKLASVQAHLPQPADKELVPPVVASTWRELTPHYTVKEIFSTKREEVRAKAADVITRKLGADGIVVEEVMLSDIQLPEQYSRGLE